MPELPEVETTCRGISPHILNKKVHQVIIRQPQLRWPVPDTLNTQLSGQPITKIYRRAKYLLLETPTGTLIIHLGMSGSLRIINDRQAAGKHDHIDFVFSDSLTLRFNDPRRFGAVLWTKAPVQTHPLLKQLGPEPLSDLFNGEHLYQKSRQRKKAVKTFIMDNHIVVGVGNIYANEALFKAGIHPMRQAGRISLARYQQLATEIKNVLTRAIEQGGTTLKDFVNEQGKPGYFQQSLSVYGRENQPCLQCGNALQMLKIGQRSSYFCKHCQR